MLLVEILNMRYQFSELISNLPKDFDKEVTAATTVGCHRFINMHKSIDKRNLKHEKKPLEIAHAIIEATDGERKTGRSKSRRRNK